MTSLTPDISVRVPTLSVQENGFVESSLDTSNAQNNSILSPSPSPSPSSSSKAPSSLFRRLKARASALSLRKAAASTPAQDTPALSAPTYRPSTESRIRARAITSPTPSLRHAHSYSDAFPSSSSRARSASLFSCTSVVLTRSLCSKRSIERRAISNPSSSPPEFIEFEVGSAFEKPRRAPRPPIPSELVLKDDYKMECASEPHFKFEDDAGTQNRDSGFIDSIVSLLPYISNLI